MKRVLIWVQHLLGTGHTVRAAAIARAVQEAGAEVTLVLGAEPPATLDLAGLEIIQLTPVLATDASFHFIEAVDGTPYEFHAEDRTAALLAAIERLRPDVFLVETFPFGRRRFAEELFPALDAVRAYGGRTATSIRDVLVRKPPEKERAMADVALELIDIVLVHADPQFVTLGESFSLAGELEDRIRYTGFVDGGARPARRRERSGIVVSAGGSQVGHGLLSASVDLAMRNLTRNWHILVPPSLTPIADHWREVAARNTIIEVNRPDFRELLAGAAVSVSQAGYNTVLDVLATGPRAVFVPFAAHEETEQTDRAMALAKRGLAVVLPELKLTPKTLSMAIARAVDAPPPPRQRLDLNGARKSAAILLEGL